MSLFRVTLKFLNFKVDLLSWKPDITGFPAEDPLCSYIREEYGIAPFRHRYALNEGGYDRTTSLPLKAKNVRLSPSQFRGCVRRKETNRLSPD